MKELLKSVKNYLLSVPTAPTISINRQVVWSLIHRIEELERINEERSRAIKNYVTEEV